jgi:hypothetical protein
MEPALGAQGIVQVCWISGFDLASDTDIHCTNAMKVQNKDWGTFILEVLWLKHRR